MSEQRQICGAEDELEFIGFVCELAPGHAGEHESVYYWVNKPHGPKVAPMPNRLLPQIWAESLYEAQRRMAMQQAEAVASHSPFVNPAATCRSEEA